MGASSSCPDCSGITPFRSSKSSSFTSSSDNKTFNLTYGSGGVQGQVGTDTVSVAGITLRNASVGVATNIDKSTLSSPTAGLMGLGFQALSAEGVTPFWQAAPLSDRVFTFTLTRATTTDTTQPGGTFTLGSIPSQYRNDAIDWIPLDSAAQQNGFWGIPLSGIRIGSKTITPEHGQDAMAVDTGTSLWIVPPQIASQVYAQIPSSASAKGYADGYYQFPCDASIQVSLQVGGKTYALNPDDFNAGAVSEGGSTCLGAIVGMDTGGSSPPYIMGDAAIKSFPLVAFRAEPAAVGFVAPSSGSSSSSSSSSSSGSGSGVSTSSTGGAAPAPGSNPSSPSTTPSSSAPPTSTHANSSSTTSPVALNSSPSPSSHQDSKGSILASASPSSASVAKPSAAASTTSAPQAQADTASTTTAPTSYTSSTHQTSGGAKQLVVPPISQFVGLVPVMSLVVSLVVW